MVTRRTEQFRQWVLEQVKSMPPGSRLPADGALAETWQLSLRSVKKVMSELGARGQVIRRQAKGSFTPSAAQDTSEMLTVTTKASSVDSLVQLLTEAIQLGRFEVGTALPAVKQLTLSYGVSQHTVIRAYKILQQRGVVRKLARNYWVGALEALKPRGNSKIVYTLYDDAISVSDIFTADMMSEAFLQLDEILQRLDTVHLFAPLSSAKKLLDSWSKTGQYPFGIILHKSSESTAKAVLRMLQTHYKQKAVSIPVLADAWHHISSGAHWLSIMPRGQVLTQWARTLAHYIAGGRFTKTTIVFNLDTRLWHQFEPSVALMRLRYELQQLPQIHDITCVVYTQKEEDARQSFCREVGQFSDLLGQLGLQTAREFAETVQFHADIASAYRNLCDTTFWICSQDADIAWLQRQLAKDEIEVPRKCQLLGLEKNPQYYHNGISFCGPDWYRIGYTMAHFLIGDIPIAKTSRGFIKTSARVVHKLTTTRTPIAGV